MFLVRDSKKCCLGFIIPKSMGFAHKRNKFKRQCKNVYEILKNVVEILKDISVVDKDVDLQGRRLSIILSPK